MTNNNGKNKRSKKSSKQVEIILGARKKLPLSKKGKVKNFPQLLKVITDYLKGIKKKKTQ